MNRKYVFDGQVYAQRITGQYRYADELLTEFDKIIKPHEWTIVVPQYVDLENKFQNIDVVYWGRVKGILWTQISLLIYLVREKRRSIGFCNTTPILRPGISVVHDVGYKVLKTHYKNMYGRISSLWHRLNYWVIARSGRPVITVSEFSRKQITDIYHIDKERIEIIGNGWQHYNRIQEDGTSLKNYGRIRENKFYFAIGSLEERKNFRWVIEAARRNPDELFVVAGGNVKNAKEKIDFDKIKNIEFLGYISDGCAKWLMKNCKAFLFPSVFEGFGIPPLEALSVGTKVICSHRASLPEICENSVIYVDPYDYEIDLKKLLEKPCENGEKVLEKYSWKKSARKLLEFILNLQERD